MRVSRIGEELSLNWPMSEAYLLVIRIFVVLFVFVLSKLGKFLYISTELQLVFKMIVECGLIRSYHD